MRECYRVVFGVAVLVVGGLAAAQAAEKSSDADPPAEFVIPARALADTPAPSPAAVAPGAPLHEAGAAVAIGANNCCRCPQLWFQAEYLMWWVRDAETPPLATAGTPASLGVLGRPGTVVLFGGDVDQGLRSGARFTAGGVLDELGGWGAEVSGFFLPGHTVHFAAGSEGEPVIARPFFNALTGRESAEQVANPALPGLLPLAGRVTVDMSSRLWGFDPNLVQRCCLGCGLAVDLLAGFRYLDLDEGLTATEDLRVPATSPLFPGARFLVRDDFGTDTDFYGGQVGTRLAWQGGPLSLELLGKVALGCSHQRATVSGATGVVTPGAPPAAFVGGLLAQRTNIGTYERDRFAVLPEVAVKAGCRLTGHLRATLGYSFLALSSAARPGDQIDRVVNPTQLPPGTLIGPARPAFHFQGTDFWAQGLTFGLELTY